MPLAMSQPLRPATAEEIPLVHHNLKAALAETFPHLPAFQAREAARFSPDYLRVLSNANPAYVFIVDHLGQNAGFMLAGPEQGNLVYYWGYIDPAQRKGGLALASMAQFTKHWDNGRFHKISAYTTAENRIAQLLMQRNGYKQIARLEKHIYGQDFLLFERALNKTVAGYDETPSLRLRQLIATKLKSKLRMV